MSYQLHVDVQWLNSGGAIMHLDGDVTRFADQVIYNAYHEISAKGIKKIIIFLAEGSIVHSPGMSILVDIIVRTQKSEQQLVFIPPNNHYQRIFSLIGLVNEQDMFLSLDAAKQYLGLTTCLNQVV